MSEAAAHRAFWSGLDGLRIRGERPTPTRLSLRSSGMRITAATPRVRRAMNRPRFAGGSEP